MRKLLWSSILALFICQVLARAEDWTTTDGKTYKDVTVVKIEDDAVTILDSDGGALVPLDKLPPNLQQKFHYDPAKAKLAAAQRELNDKASAQAESAERQIANEKQNQQDAQDAAAAQDKAADQAARKTAIPLVFEVSQVLPDGVLADKMKADFDTPVADSAQSDGGGGGVGPGGGVVYRDSGTVIFVEIPSAGLAESQQLHKLAAPDGTYTYTDTDGASRTVEKWKSIQ